MGKKCFLRSVASAMLLCALALTSCVQDDMYELYDDGFESGFLRKKRSKDYGNMPDPCGINYPSSGANIPSTIAPAVF